MAPIFPLLLFSISVLLLHFCCGLDDATVEIESGVRIRGSQMKTLNERKFFAFRGIPYAEPPVGEFRFKPPVRKQWKENFFDASEMGPWCIQMDFLLMQHKELFGQEDCLILNVYTHNVEEPLRKVMVFIHGGAFIVGSSNEYGPRRLLDRSVVLVTINYRLGPFGFLSTMDEASPGNYGLLDQTEALKWVKRNIAAFGGDPNKITIFGESAGSASVMNHLISPLSSGLFQRAIGHSGTVLSSWSEQTDALKWTKLLAEKVDCAKPDTKLLIDCLRDISADDLRKAANDISDFDGSTLFSPVADGTFHSQFPSKLLRNGLIANKVPLLLGVTRDEGLLFAPSIYLKSPQFSDELIRKIMAITLNLYSEQIPNDLVQVIQKQYFPLEVTRDKKRLLEAMGKVISDGAMVTDHYNAAQFLLAQEIKLFLFSHDYITNHSIIKNLGLNDFECVAHVDDMFYLFDIPNLFPKDFEIPNDETENNFLDTWTSFAENGYPFGRTADGIVNWRPSTSESIYVYHMDKKIQMRIYEPKSDWRLDFWLRKVPSILKNTKNTREEL